MGGLADRLAQRAKAATEALKAEYEAGKRGDDTPSEPIWPTPRQQLEALSRLMGKRPADPEPDPHTVRSESSKPSDRSETSKSSERSDTERAHESEPSPSPPVTSKPAEPSDADLDEVAAHLTAVDWEAVRSAVGDRSSEVASAARSMAQNVDWAKVQPVAAQVSTALIAAVAAGRLPLAGRLGPIIAQAIAGQGGVGQRLANRTPAPVRRDFERTVIEVSSTDGPPSAPSR